MSDQTLIFLLAFGSVALLAYIVTAQLFKGEDKLKSRLKDKAHDQDPNGKKGPAAAPLLQRLGQAASRPFMPTSAEKQSALRRRLGYAGIYSAAAVKAVHGCKFIFLSVGFLLGYLIGYFVNSVVVGMCIGGLIGYMAPVLWLRVKTKRNQKSLEYGLADALDLMVVCVEAGLTVDAAMQRVGDELALVHPSLSREMSIAHMESRVGVARSESLRNLGVRTGCEPLQSLASMLIQADRFGTSIASALRVHAETLRLARQHKAEEMAAKSSVKMSIPLVLFIFPATFIVLIGPTVIQLMNSPLM